MMNGSGASTKRRRKQLIDITSGSSDAEVKVVQVKLLKDKR